MYRAIVYMQLFTTALTLTGFQSMSWRFTFIRRYITPSQKHKNVLSMDDMARHEYFMNIALDQARKSERRHEVPIGAVIVRNNYEVLAQSHNMVESNHDASAHAELEAMKRAAKRIGNWRLQNCTLYTTLEPCPLCLSACLAFRIQHIVYGAPDLRLGAINTYIRMLDNPHPFHNVSSVTIGVKIEESRGMLKQFFKHQRAAKKKV